jgi:hypothetical protein
MESCLGGRLYRIQNHKESNMRLQVREFASFHVLIFMAADFIISFVDSLKGTSFKEVAFIAKETERIVTER